MASKRSAVDTLTELLDKLPDAATLEILLEPEHLLKLLRAHGWSDDAIRRDLTGGERSPGELLLDVLAKEPDPAVLLALLGDPAPRPATPRPATPRPATPAPAAAKFKPIPAIVVGIVLAGVGGWFLFVKLDFLHHPKLLVHFPGAYALLFTVLLGGLLMIGAGVRALRRRA
ncbi:MAG: hypothetical protein R3B09_08835 [Nannocystaceae bacterium]